VTKNAHVAKKVSRCRIAEKWEKVVENEGKYFNVTRIIFFE